MRFCVLGSLRVETDHPTPVRGPQVGRLLGALLIDAGAVVSVDRLSEIVFDGHPTDAAATTLRSYVARLRRLLPEDGTGVEIVTDRPGYRLELGTSTVDAHELEAIVRRARRRLDHGDVDAARSDVDAALRLWRGRAFAEFADEEWAMLEALRIEEVRREATVLRFELLLAAGEAHLVAADIGRFAEEHPHHESVWAMWVLALYRTGRQTEALRVAARYRRQLVDVGLEPGADFATLERQVAGHDPSIRSPVRPTRRMRGYRVVTELGSGRHGRVDVAIQEGIEREVVVRSFGPGIADDSEFIRGFATTVQQVARIDHPHLVPIQDFWREPGSAHLVTRRLRGGNLRGLIAKGPAAVERVAAMVEQVGAALEAAHRVGLAHCRLGAGDVLFDDDGNAFVDGIGSAAALDALVDAPPPGDPTGTTAVSIAADDQCALATMAFRALAGIGDEGGATGGRDRLLISRHRPELLALDGVFARAAAPDPDDRYPDIVAFTRSFLHAVGRPAKPPAGRRAVPNPYQGLHAFHEADAERFFGRDRFVEQLLARLASGRQEDRFVTVVGASGSGKSSVIRAGLLPRVRAGAVAGSERWLITTMVPGRAPFAAWDAAMGEVAVAAVGGTIDSARQGLTSAVRRAVAAGAELLVVIDQFEELFTTVDDESVRREFIAGLVAAASDPTVPLRIVAALRADLYDGPLAHHQLGALVSGGAVSLVGMSPSELEEAVVGPARRAGIDVDGALVAELVAAASDRAGMLPLVEFSLTELFEQRSADALTLAEHRRLGGLSGAIAGRAEHVYRTLDDRDREAARVLFLRLVTFGGSQPDVRRRITRSELGEIPALARSADALLERFGAARLLTFDRDRESRRPTVEVAHEALLTNWPRLRAWIADEGRGLEVRAELTQAAAVWDRAGRDPADLYRAARLATAEVWAATHRDDLTPVEREFLGASTAGRDAEQERQRRQLEQQRTANRRLCGALAGVGLVLVVALVLGALALGQRDRARQASGRADEARGRALAATALEVLPADRSLALLLAVEANLLDDSPVASHALLGALGGEGPLTRTLIPTPASDYTALAVAGDGRIAAAKRGEGSVDVIDLARRAVEHARLAGAPSPVGGVDVDPTGSLVAISGLAGEHPAVVVHDVESGDVVADVAGDDGELHDARFTPDGRYLAVAGGQGGIELYGVADWQLASAADLGDDRTITAMAVSADGGTVIVGATPLDGLEPLASARLYAVDIESGDVTVGPVELDEAVVTAIGFGDDDTVIVGGDRLRAHSASTLDPIGEPFGETFLGFYGVAVGDDGLVAAAGGIDLQLFTGEHVAIEHAPGLRETAAGVVFLDGGRSMVTAGFEGSLWVWTTGWIDDLGEPLEPIGPGLVAVSPDGGTLAVWGHGRGVQLHDRATLALRGELPIDPARHLAAVDFSAGGSRVAALSCPPPEADSCAAELTVWDTDELSPLAGPVDVGPVWAGATHAAAFSADGDHVVVAGFDGDIVLRDAATLRPVGDVLRIDDVAPLPGSQVRTVGTALVDGRSLVVAKGELSEAAVWDITDGIVQPVGAITGNINQAAFTPSGRIFAEQGSGAFELLDPSTLAAEGRRFVSAIPTRWIGESDTGLLVTSSDFGTELWDVATGQTLSGRLASTSAALAPDGATLYLGGSGAPGSHAGDVVRVVPLDRAALVEDACARAGRNLTDDEWARYMPAGEPRRATCEQWPTGGQ